MTFISVSFRLSRTALSPWIFREIRELMSGRIPVPVTDDEKKAMIIRHYRMMLMHKPEKITVREMRKHIGWYIRGRKGAAQFRGEINRYIGATYYKKNDYETALKYLNKSIQLDSEGAIDTWVFMGESYIALGEYEKAIEPLRKAIEAWKPNDDYDLAYLESRLKFAKEKLGDNSTENDDEGSSVCPKCGAKVVSEDPFCRKCGNRLKEND